MRWPLTLEERFWSRIEKSDGCWTWIGRRNKRGYGCIHVRGKEVLAHRLSWELNVGPRDGLNVLHKCDNPPCVRPDHLFLGTQKTNMEDCKAKGRNARGQRSGWYAKPERRFKRSASAKLSDEQVVALRKLRETGLSYKKIGEAFGVSESSAYFTIKRKYYANVPEDK